MNTLHLGKAEQQVVKTPISFSGQIFLPVKRMGNDNLYGPPLTEDMKLPRTRFDTHNSGILRYAPQFARTIGHIAAYLGYLVVHAGCHTPHNEANL